MASQDPVEPSADKSSPGRMTEGEIRVSGTVIQSIIIPVAVLVALFVAVIIFTPRIAACEDFYIIKLIYPFLFGALGVILGGSVVIDGSIPFLGGKSNMRVAGGIAGAVLGFAMASFAQPTECEGRHAIILKRFPASGSIAVISNGLSKTREYIGLYETTSTSVTTTVERTSEDTRDLKFKFGAKDKSKDGFLIVLRFYRSDIENSQRFEFAWRCVISAEIGAPPSTGVQKYQLMASEPLRYEVEFNPNFFKEVEEALKKSGNSSDVTCLKGRSKLDGDGPLIEDRVSVPFYVSRLKGYFEQELWYVVEKPNVVSDKAVARQQEVVNGELSVGGKAQSSAGGPVSNKMTPSSDVERSSRQVANCSADSSQRSLIDRFMAGDDLDPGQRRDLYKQWTSIHCYVWPLVKASADALERSRAIKFSVNAIINNSLVEAEPAYWQPTGGNKRDFSRPLPLMTDTDYKLIFDLVRSDDLTVRTEATRFIRNLPVDKFSILFNEHAEKQDSIAGSQRERVAIAAAFCYYGRIVEWLDQSADDSNKVIAAVNGDFSSARRWITKASLGESAKAYEAMLWYAKAIVERERIKADDGRGSFKQVVDSISSTSEPYPSNPLHLAQSTAITFGDSTLTPSILKEIKTADGYSSSTPLSYPGAPSAIPLNAGPGENFKRSQAKSLTNINSARMLLRKGDWLFVQYRDQIGWIKREIRNTLRLRLDLAPA